MRKFLYLLAFLCASPALAEAPAEIAPYVHAQKPYGTGRVTFSLLTVYDAALYTDSNPFATDKPFALQLTYRHSFSASRLVDKTKDLMGQVDQVPVTKRDEYGKRLLALWPDVKSGDTITAVNIPGEKVLFFYNGTLRGAVDDPSFGKPFFDIWLSENTTEPACRQALLAGN